MIITSGLKLINFTKPYAEAMFKGDKVFAGFLGVIIPENWSDEKLAIETFYNENKNDPANFKWSTYLIIHKKDNKLIGCCGFKGKPNNGSVEIGYEIHPDYRGRGLAKEAANGLINFAFTYPEVDTVLAHTLAEENASVSILKGVGFSFIKQYNDPDDGEIWQWEISRQKL